MSKPRIVHIAPIAPALGGNGLAMRAGLFSEAAAGLGDTLAIVIDQGADETGSAEFCGAEVRRVPARSRPDTRLALIRDMAPLASRAGLLREYGRSSASIALSMPVIEEALQLAVRHHPDLVIVSRAYLLPLAQLLSGRLPAARLLVDLDDDDAAVHLAYARMAAGQENRLQAQWHEAEADVSDRQIVSMAARVAAFTCASDEVRRSVEGRLGLANLFTTPNAAPEASAQSPATTVRDQFLFVGNLSYPPNIDALEWFVETIWPQLLSRKPKLQLCVAGSLPGQKVRALCAGPAIRLVANPTSLAPVYARALAAVVPIRFGSGSRIKILEAGANQVPVITTFKGAEGLELEAGFHAFLADETPSGFLDACLACLDHRKQAARTTHNLHQLVMTKFARAKVLQQLADLLARLA